MNSATSIYTTRSDAALCREVTSFLSGHDFPALRGIVVEAAAGVVTLRGPVKSYYAKQVLVKGCQRAPGVACVVDELYVVRSKPLRRPQVAEQS